MNACTSCQFLQTTAPERLLHDGRSWSLALSPDQQYLGKVFLTLKRHTPAMRELTTTEAAELFEVMKRFEIAVDTAFVPTHFNWSCLMNHAAGTGEPAHVHWHGIPRYKDSRKVAGMTFVDRRWPGSARDLETQAVTPEVLAAIRDTINQHFLP